MTESACHASRWARAISSFRSRADQISPTRPASMSADGVVCSIPAVEANEVVIRHEARHELPRVERSGVAGRMIVHFGVVFQASKFPADLGRNPSFPQLSPISFFTPRTPRRSRRSPHLSWRASLRALRIAAGFDGSRDIVDRGEQFDVARRNAHLELLISRVHSFGCGWLPPRCWRRAKGSHKARKQRRFEPSSSTKSCG
jgi:hypothetical protein